MTKRLFSFEYWAQTNMLEVGHSSWNNTTSRGYIEFNLSAIPSDATITSASLHFYCLSPIGTNTNTGGTIILKNLDYTPMSFYYLDDWNFLNGTSTFTSFSIDWAENKTVGGADLVTKINSSWDGLLYFGMINSAETSNGLSLSLDNSDFYLSVTYEEEEEEEEEVDIESPTTPGNLRNTSTYWNANYITLTWDASSDNVGVAGYKIYKDGVYHSQTSNTSFIVNGLYSTSSVKLSVKAYDAAGNLSAQAIDTEAPSKPSWFTYNDYDNEFVWNKSHDNIGHSGNNFYIDGVLKYTGTRRYYPNHGGYHTYSLEAYDAWGNKSPKMYITGSFSQSSYFKNSTTGNTINPKGKSNKNSTLGNNISDSDLMINVECSIYPNPTSGIIKINGLNINSNYRVVISNYLGVQILDTKITDTKHEINLDSYKSGIYFISIYDSNEQLIKSQKIIKN